MLFEASRFEEFFNEQTLEKAFSLFRRGYVKFLDKPGHFLVGRNELNVRKKGDKVLSYTCTCARKKFCEHLCAVLFFLQQESLVGIVPRNRINKSQSTGILDELNKKATAFIKPFLQKDILNQKDINAIADLVKKFKKIPKQDSGGNVLVHLALVMVYTRLFQKRFSGNEHILKEQCGLLFKKLEEDFSKGLSSKEKKAWIQAGMYSISSNRNLYSGTFEFLIPRTILLLKNNIEFEGLNKTLSARAYKMPFSESLDKFLIVKAQLAIRVKKVLGKNLNYPHDSVESVIAAAELGFCELKIGKSLKLLDANYEKVMAGHPQKIKAYREYLLLQVQKFNHRELEVKYLKENFLHSPYIAPQALDRFSALLSKKIFKHQVIDLVATLRNDPGKYSFDKVSLLLLRAQLYDEIIEEIKRQKNKFGLLHEVVVYKLPDYNSTLLRLYADRLLEAFTAARSYYHQQRLFDAAKGYINKLPRDGAVELLENILEKLGGQTKIHGYIAESYPALIAI